MDIYTNSYKYIARVASSSASRNADARDASHRRARGATDDDAAHKISRAGEGTFLGRARGTTLGHSALACAWFGHSAWEMIDGHGYTRAGYTRALDPPGRERRARAIAAGVRGWFKRRRQCATP